MTIHCDFCHENDATHSIDVHKLENNILVNSYDICDECLERMI